MELPGCLCCLQTAGTPSHRYVYRYSPYRKSLSFFLSLSLTKNYQKCSLQILMMSCAEEVPLYDILTMISHPVAAIAYTASWPGVITNLTSVRCRGTESGLLNCIHAIGSCSSSKIAGVRCYGDIVAGMSVCMYV